MPLKFYVSQDQLNALSADQWAQTQREKLANDWQAQTQASLQPAPYVPSVSESLSRLGSGFGQPSSGGVDSTVSAPFSESGRQLTDVTNQVSAAPTPTAPPAPSLPDVTSENFGGAGATSTRAPIPTPAPAPSPTPSPTTAPMTSATGYEALARDAATRHGLDPDIFVRQLQQESGLQPTNPDGSVKTSPAGARGIAQFMPDTARGLGINPDDPGQAIEGAATLMAQNLQKYGGDYSKALAAYNAGPGNVDKYGGVPPFAETQAYVSKILSGAGSAVSGAVQAAGNAVSSAVSSATGNATPDLGLSQFGDKTISAEDAYAACGPAAAARLATIYGDAIPLNVALQAAKQVGWTPQGGMNGIANEKKLMDALGLPATLDTSGDWTKILADASAGKVVTISTPGHYFTANGTRPRADGQTELYVGQSGLDLKGGKAWMTPTEIEQVMGAVNGALTSDPGQAVQAGQWMQKASMVAGQPPETAQDALKSLQDAQQKTGVQSVSPQPGPLDAIARPFGAAFQGLQDVAGQVGGAVSRFGTEPAGQPASMQPTPSDTLTNPLGTGNAATNAPGPSQPGLPTLGNEVMPPAQPTIFDQYGAASAAGRARLAGQGLELPSASSDVLPMTPLTRENFPSIADPNHPINVASQLQDKYFDPADPLGLRIRDRMTPADRQAYDEAQMTFGATASPLEVAGATRMFHGTGSDFARPEPGQFDSNGLFGPGYYLTDSPAVAGGVFGTDTATPGYAQARAVQEGLAPEQKADLLRRVDTARATLANNPSPELRAYVEQDLANAQARLDTDVRGMGANVRAVDVPQNLNLLNADAPLAIPDKNAIAQALSNPFRTGSGRIISDRLSGDARQFLRGTAALPGDTITGEAAYSTLLDMFDQSKDAVNGVLAKAGFDGIRYNGGQRIPMQDAAGAPIEHNAVVVFPESLDKLRNAISGTQGGQASVPFATTLGGAAAGGVTAYQTTDPNDPNRALKIAGGALAGGTLGYGAGRLAGNPAVQQFAVDESGALRLPGARKGVPPETTPPSVTTPALGRMVGTPEQQAAVSSGDAERAANILLSKFPEDVRPLLKDTADRFGQFAGQRRGVVTDAAAQSSAAELALGTTPEKWIRTPPGKAFTQDQAIALGNTLTQVGTDYQSMAADVLSARAAGTVTPQMEADLADKALEWAALAGVRSGAAAEAGRTLRSFRQTLTGGAYADKNRAIEAAFKAIGADRGKFADWVQAFSQIPANDQVAQYKMLQGLNNPTWLDRISILRYASMLSATTTHLVNALGNTINVGLDIAAKPVTVGVDVARAAVTGGERTRYMGELGPQVDGLLRGAIAGMSDAWNTLKTGVNPSDLGKFEAIRPGFQSGNAVVDAIVEMPLRALGASDNVFRGAAKGAEVGALAARQGIQEGLAGKALRDRITYITQNLPEFPQLAAEADKRAAAAVLQEPNKMASAFTGIGRGPGAVSGAERIVREMVIPFAKTPANVLAQGLGMTPLGALKVIDRINAKETGAATDAAARVLFGSTVAAGMGALAANGFVTGGFPADPKERETLPPGWQPWSLRLPDGNGGFRYLEFSRLGPVSIPLAIGAVVGQSLREGQVADPVTLASSLGKFMLDQTFLQGLSDVTDAIKDPKRSGEKLSETLATSYVPYASLSRQITRALGMADRDPKGAVQAIMAINPLTADQIPRRQDALGRDIHSTQSGIGAVVSPIRYSQSNAEPVLNAFREVGMGIPPAPSEISVTSTVTGATSPPIALSEVEQKTYQRIFGDRLNERVSGLVTQPDWAQRTLASRKATLDQQVQAARDYAKSQVFSQIPQDERTRRMQEGRQRQLVKPLPAP